MKLRMRTFFTPRKIGIFVIILTTALIYYHGTRMNQKYFSQEFSLFNRSEPTERNLRSTLNLTKEEFFGTLALDVAVPKENLIKETEALAHISSDATEKDNRVIYTVLILISSHVTHRERRNAIRKSWGNSSTWATTDKYKIVFLTGKVKEATSMTEIAEEAKESRDIISLDIPEDFYLLAKKVIIGLIWAKHNMKFKAILKGDDDTFMNLDNIIAFINQNTVVDGYFGAKMVGQPVNRNGQYKLTKEEHENDFYDPYCSGGGYIFTNSSVYKIIPILDLEKTINIDDAYIGEVALKAGIGATMINGFYMWNTWCEYRKDIKVSHPSKEPECVSFLLKKSMIDNGKLPHDPQLENQKYFKNISLTS